MVELIFDDILRSSERVAHLATGGIHPAALPTEVALPAIHYLFVGGGSQATQDTFGSQRYRVEVNCWGNSYSHAVTLRHAVIAALSQYSDRGVFLSFIQPTDFFDHDLRQFRAMAEFYIFANFTP
jgi:hypothetical protein